MIYMVNNSPESYGVKSTTKSYPTTRANRSVQGAPRGRVSYGSAAGRGPPPGLRGSPGNDFNDRNREFELESRRETVISMRRAATASGDHHGLCARSAYHPLGLEAIASAVGGAASRATHVTRNREFEFDYEISPFRFTTVPRHAARPTADVRAWRPGQAAC